MLFFPLLLFLVPALTGIGVTAYLQLCKEKITLLLVGATLGLSVFITALYGLTLFLPLARPLIGVVTALSTLLCIGTIFLPKTRAHWRQLTFDRTAAIVFLSLSLLFLLIAPKLLVLDQGELKTGILNAWGDMAWHMANITNFAQSQPFPPQDPIFAGHQLFYPFLVNFFSAVLLKSGASFTQSVVLPALLLIPLLGTLLYCLIREIAGSRRVAVLALLLFFLGGSTFAWLYLRSDWQVSSLSRFQFLLHLPRDYSGTGGDEHGYHFLNPVMSLLLPQRAFLFGMPLAFSILLLLVSSPKKQTMSYLVAGVMAGLLPLFHTHTILALIPIIIALFFVQPSVSWLIFFLTAAIVGFPEIVYYALGHQESSSFFRFSPGWTAADQNLFLFWFKNTGLIIPVIVIGFFTRAPRLTKIFAAAGAIIFIIANLFLFAPWAWDNFKLLIFWLIFSLPLISWVIVKGLRRAPGPLRALIIFALCLHMLGGSLDLWKTALPTTPLWGEWDGGAIQFAQAIQNYTPPRAVILTASYHNTPVALSGRLMYLGFPGHVWSHGGSPFQREAAVHDFYEGKIETLPDLQPPYVMVGPIEREKYSALKIRASWQLLTQVGEYQLYRLPL